MKFNRLNDDKLQILISKEDLQKRNLKKWDIVPYNPMAHKMFQDILEEAYHECGFEVEQDTQLMIEAYPMTGESMLLTVTKVGATGKGLFDFEIFTQTDDFAETFISDDEDEFHLDLGELVYGFNDLEDVIESAKRVEMAYFDVSSLYKCGGKYYLLLNAAEAIEPQMSLLSEYGELEDVASAYIMEHGQVMIAEKALGILASL